ncbi:membrane hypothetical protein [Gammaproteobacteria bacterium]
MTAAISEGVGYTTDPFKGQLADDFYWNPFVLLFTLLGVVFPSLTQYRTYFSFHNWRQWHVFETAITSGWNCGALKLLVVPALPECPPLFQDVPHYWKFGGFIGVVAYLVFAFLWVHLAGVILSLILSALAFMGVISPSQVLTIILKSLFGITI